MPTLVISGANRGLGLEFCRQYLACGWDIFALCRRSSDELDKLAASGSLTKITCDLTDDDSLADAVSKIDAQTVDLLINNAGTMGAGSFADEGIAFQSFGQFNRQDWLRIFDINVCTPMALSELLVDKIERADNGKIVTLSSMVASNAWNKVGNLYGYRASKAAVNSMMKSMGINLAERGITAVAIQPAWVKTEMGGPNADVEPPEAIESLRNTIAGINKNDAGKLFTDQGEEAPY